MNERGGIFSTPLRIVMLYAAIGAAWILFSDRAVTAAFHDGAQAVAQSVKGGLYVVATAVLLYVLMRRHLREKETLDEHVRTVLDAMTDAAFVIDHDGRVVDANQAALALVGAFDREAVLRPLDDLVALLDLREVDGRRLEFARSASRRALAGETVGGYEARLRRGDGLERVVRVSAAPLRQPGDPKRALALTVIQDRTAEKQLEEAREDFLATAAHEFKTPLAVVKAYGQLMARRAQGDPVALEVIARQVDRLTRMVEQLLEVSRLRAGGAELRRDPFDLADVLSDVAGGMGRRHRGGRVKLGDLAPAPVDADRQRIAQVISELLDNALRFSPEGGDVQAWLEARDGEIVLSVRDHGVGIAPDRQPRIFERYYRAHSGTGQDYGGLGLGLGMCREIITRHGGRIGFESEPGTGSTFWFSLPRRAGAPA